MNESVGKGNRTLSPSTALRVERVCKRFEAAWKAGRGPRIHDFLDGMPEPQRPILLHELIPLDAEYRREHGEDPQPADYQDRFPGLNSSWLACAIAAPTRKTSSHSPSELAAGDRVADFEILRLLGSGGWARVYLARQISLDRLVALKVSANKGSEARVLARLEHHHIVQVFTEFTDSANDLNLLCMQFVPGMTLGQLIKCLAQRPQETWSGSTFLKVLDELCTEATPFDLGGLNIRSFLQTCDHAELVCWIGARLAEALAHAHSQGIIHRDIKPANILVNRYGRPLLADFNIALNPVVVPGGDTSFGGTVSYMSPEHLDAFNLATTTAPEVVDARSDLYSLGVVLFELLTGRSPFAGKVDSGNFTSLGRLAAERRAGAPAPRDIRPETPELLDRLVRRCLQPEPERRFQSAASLMHALDGCRELLHVERQQASPGPAVRCSRTRPLTMLLFLAFLPHLVGSALNIAYNELRIVESLNACQQTCFRFLVLGYNAVTYPLLTLVALALVWRVFKGIRRLRTQADLSAAESAMVRRQALALPGRTVMLSCLGWFPGGLLFPAALHAWAGPLPERDSVHFLISFVLSGLVALTYCYFGVQFVVLRALYTQLWSDPSDVRKQAQHELQSVSGRLRLYQFLAVLIPLTGAALLISVGPDELSLSFRMLVTALMILGLAGLALATTVCNSLNRTLVLLTGSPQSRQ